MGSTLHFRFTPVSTVTRPRPFDRWRSETTRLSSTAGTIFITDTSANKIYMLTKPYFPSNEVYTAANVANVVGLLDLNTGVVTPVATGFTGVHGLAFSPTRVALAPAKDRSEETDDE